MPNGTVESVMDNNIYPTTFVLSQRISTLSQELNAANSSAQQKLQTQTTQQFLTRPSSTSTMQNCSTILCGWQCTDTNLWYVPLSSHTPCHHQQYGDSSMQLTPNRVLTTMPFTIRCHPQRLQAQNNTTRAHPLPSHGHQISYQTNMAQGNQEQTICILAWPQG